MKEKINNWKRKKKNPFLLFGLFVFFAVSFLSLGIVSNGKVPSTPIVEPSVGEGNGIRLNAGKIRFRNVGDTYTITATIEPSNASFPKIEWTTSNASKIAIVSQTNLSCTIKRMSTFADSVTITATAKEALSDYVSSIHAEVSVRCYLSVAGVSKLNLFQANSGNLHYFSKTDSRLYMEVYLTSTLHSAEEWTIELQDHRSTEFYQEAFGDDLSESTFVNDFYNPCTALSHYFRVSEIDEGMWGIEEGKPIWYYTFILEYNDMNYSNQISAIEAFFGSEYEKTVTMDGASDTIPLYVFMNKIIPSDTEVIL